jgi:hypothetical protein
VSRARRKRERGVRLRQSAGWSRNGHGQARPGMGRLDRGGYGGEHRRCRAAWGEPEGEVQVPWLPTQE